MIASGVLVTDRDAGTVAYAANPTDEVYAVVSMDNFGPGVVHFAVQMHNVTDPQSLRVSYTCMSDGTLCQETTWSGSGELFSVEFSVNSSVYTTHGVMMEIGHGSQTISQFFSYPVTVAQDLFLAGVSSQDCGTVAKCVVSKWTWTSMLNPVHVAMGFTPGASVTPDHMRSSVLGDVMIPGTLNSSQLRLSNLAPTNRTYKTLEEVNCKLLTVDSNGHFQLIDYMPERCA
ncbi:MAG: hypothetical protein H6766_01205 [Candidatus Peribacteria bacterium]|nr:MAG: hypothetical protein H6766_01205 [Candidatus Peribacteria bacterium]